MATEKELASVRPRLFGLIDEARIAAVDFERPPHDLIDDLRNLTDLSSSVSDALDELGVGGAASASILAPVSTGGRVIGPAITIRYIAHDGNVGALRGRGERGRLADRDLYSVGQPGDVAVFDCGGYVGASVVGGLSAAWASRTEMGGCVVDGSVRDVGSIRSQGIPVWSRGVTPVTGKHRLEAVEINGAAALAGMAVRPGDLVVADDSGVCVIPSAHVRAVRNIAVAAESAEHEVTEAIARGASPEEVARILRPERW